MQILKGGLLEKTVFNKTRLLLLYIYENSDEIFEKVFHSHFRITEESLHSQ